MKPEELYKALYGQEMPDDTKRAFLTICGATKMRTDDPLLTLMVALGYYDTQYKVIPEQILTRTKEAGAAISAHLQKGANELIKASSNEAAKAAQEQAQRLQNEFTATCSQTIKRVANEARGMAPAAYRITAAIFIAGIGCMGFLAGWWGGQYKVKSGLLDQLRKEGNVYEFSSLDVMVGGKPMGGFSLNGGRIQFFPKKDAAGKVPKLPEK